MDVLVFGGSGLIGQALAEQLQACGDHVWIFSRKKASVTFGEVVQYTLSTLQQDIESLALRGSYAIVNLAGESISGGRWTDKRQAAIYNSRIELTEQLADTIRRLAVVPEVFVSGSAIGYYGSSTSRTFTESSPCGVGFLPDVTRAWEAAAHEADPYTRVVLLRTGVVLSRKGGALVPMVKPYAFFVGGRVGTGQQWVSWIHIADVTGIILHVLHNPAVKGVVNVTAPNPVTMDEFGRCIGTVLSRPHWFPVPTAILKAVFGDMSEVLLEGQRVLPNTLLHTGYSFQYPELKTALSQLLKQTPHY
jgi:uncharacterized protein